MASTISSIDKSIQGLAPSFQTAIKAIIEAESNPLNKVEAQKDSIDIRRSVYTDLKTNFDGLNSALKALISTEDSFGMNLVSASSILPGTAGTTVLSATSTESAAVADYDITVTELAKAQSKSMSTSYSPDAAMGKSGVFWLGGNGIQEVSLTPTDTVTASATSTVASDQRELGTGAYALEIRTFEGLRQFRLVDADGNAVSILKQTGTSSYTNAWQSLTDGSIDTGRGLTLTLDASGVAASTTLTYTAAGSSIDISSTDSLRNITNAINAVSQPEGRDFRASIVDNKLVLTGAHTGENHTMLYTDGVGLGFGADLQTAQNAKFNVNGIDVSRAGNTNLSDVVDGTTISLASDAEGKTARLSIAGTSDKATGLMKTMVDKFNTALTHLKDKLASTPTTTPEGQTAYSRGPLTGDIGLRGLRFDLLSRMSRSYDNSGSFKNLAEIGLSFDDDMKLTFDSAKFSAALKNNGSDVTALLDTGLGEINSLVSHYAGSSGSLSSSLTSIDDQRKQYDARITRYNDALEKRKEALYTQYLGFQTQIADYGRTAEMFGIIFNSDSNVNTSG